MSNVIYIYGLFHPETNELRYIGKTNNLKMRLQSHIDYARSKRKQRPVSDWINSLIKNGIKPIIRQIELCNNKNWIEREMFWIKEYKHIGARILNLTDGGESNTGYIYSTELIEIRRKAKTGRVVPERERKAIAATLSKKVICNDGSFFNSIKEAIAASGIPKSTFHRKLHKGENINGKTYQFIKSYNSLPNK